VKLPFRELFNKGIIQLKLEAIPDRDDAILARFGFQHVDGEQTIKKWVQEGKGKVEVRPTAQEKYFLEFRKMESDGKQVTSVEQWTR